MNENETTGTPVPETTDTPNNSEVTESNTTVAETESVQTEPVASALEPESNTSNSEASTTKPGYLKWVYSAIAVVIVIAAFYGMEHSGKLNTQLFSGVDRFFSSHKTVATVNENKISQYDLTVSIEQITAGAEAQGVDVTSPEVQADIQSQAIDMLVNTELLKQEATVRGITIDDEAVQARLDELAVQVGGNEALEERMKEFNVTTAILRRDIKNELTIQTLLDQVFAEADISVSEEEVTKLYEDAGGVDAGLPALEEVREQIEAQVTSSKEQEIVTNFVNQLRDNAEVEVLI